MQVLVKMFMIFIISFANIQLELEEQHTIQVTVASLESNKANVFFALYNAETNFLNKSFKRTKSSIHNNKSVVTFENIPSGVYAVSVFHDENDNGKLDSNFLGIPKEDYGCSNNTLGFMGSPKWSNAKFEVKENIYITIKLK